MNRHLSCAWLVALGACTGTTNPVLTADDAAGTSDAPQNLNPWTVVPSGTATDLFAVTGTKPSDVVAVGGSPTMTPGTSGVVVRWDGTTWTVTTNLVNLLSVSRQTAVGVYAGEGSETYWNGSTWSPREVLGAGALRGTWEAPPVKNLPASGTYAVGDGGQLRYTTETGIAGSWGALPSNTTAELHAVWGSSASNVYVVGAGGVILHATDAGLGSTGTWTKTIQGSSTLTGVWGSSATNVYIVGEAPAIILHSTDGGATWTSTSPPTSALGLAGIGGRSASDIYAVGATGGVIFHSSGNDLWTAQPVPTTKDLFGVWVDATGDAYAVGRTGTIVRKAL